MSSAGAIVIRRAGEGARGKALGEVWRYRELLRSLVVRDLKVKYQRSVLGVVWTMLNPLLTVGVLVTVFTYVIRINITHYWAFLLSGYFAWSFFQQVLYNSPSVLRDHASLSRNVAFPLEILVLSTVVSKLVEFLIEMVLVAVILAVFHHGSLPASFLLFPVLVALQVVLAVGVMLPLAVLCLLYYDVQHALPVAVTILFYLTPVFYQTDMIPAVARSYYWLNPLVGVLTLYHQILYEGIFPSARLLLVVAAVAVVVLVAGYAFFKRYRDICVELA